MLVTMNSDAAKNGNHVFCANASLSLFVGFISVQTTPPLNRKIEGFFLYYSYRLPDGHPLPSNNRTPASKVQADAGRLCGQEKQLCSFNYILGSFNSTGRARTSFRAITLAVTFRRNNHALFSVIKPEPLDFLAYWQQALR